MNIVELIESNPITKLTGNYQCKLVEKVKTCFSDYEQQMFVSSFYCYLNYNSKTDFVIDLDDIWNWVGFGQKVNAKRVLEKYFVVNKDYKVLLCQLAEQKNTAIDPQIDEAKKEARGGHNKETFMLNVETFKKFCLKAGTKKADEIHDYFLKLEELLHETLQEESTELKQQLEKANQAVLQLEEQNKKDKLLEREQVLLKQYGTIGSIFYIMKIKSFEDGRYIIKVGESRAGVTARYSEHKSKYDECLLLDCFTVNRSKDFESFVKHHASVAPSKVTDLLGHEREQELFLIGRHLTYRTLLKLVESNIKQYDDNNQELATLQLKYDILKLESDNPNKGLQVNVDILKELVQNNKMLTNMVCDLTKTVEELKHIILSNEKPNQIKTVTGFGEPLFTLGPRLQCINPETMQIVKVYESVTECMSMDSKMKRPSISKAVIENTIYNGFRWLLVDRSLDPNVIVHIEPTVPVIAKTTGYIAKLNADKTAILNVYIDRKTASIENGYSASGLDNAFKNTTIINGHYYVLYDTCSEDMQTDFVLEKNNGLEPLLFKSGVGQYNEAHELVKEFACKFDCIKGLKMSDKTLEKALTNNSLYNGHYYKPLVSRIKCF
jgi:hypothetical protein